MSVIGASNRPLYSAALPLRFAACQGARGCRWNGGLSGDTPGFARPHEHLDRPLARDGILPSHWQGSCHIPANRGR